VKAETHLVFQGRCAEAFRSYHQLLGGTLDSLIRYADTPLATTVPAEWRDKVVHATLTLPGGSRLLGADVPPGSFERPQGFFVLLALDGVAEVERVFSELGRDGSVKMPLQKTFWSPCFGVVVDRFGVPWEITVG
jgi:PhnB protein